MNKTRRICWLLTICLAFALLAPCAVLTVSAASGGVTITETVNIAQANKNMEGHGYYWANRYDILTLDGIHLDTASGAGSLRIYYRDVGGNGYLDCFFYGGGMQRNRAETGTFQLDYFTGYTGIGYCPDEDFCCIMLDGYI
jgi:hypothetical protein